MRTVILMLAALLMVSACSSLPRVEVPQTLFSDELYGPPPAALQQLDVFALSPTMQAFVDQDVRRHLRSQSSARALYEAMRNKLKIDYDAAITRTAAETFDARAGNCLSLVILTSALARRLDIRVQYQLVPGERSWTRTHGVVLLNGHVDIALDPRPIDDLNRGFDPAIVIDFLPATDLTGQYTRELPEATILAMFMNNRAAETMVSGDLESAYWWARAALHKDPSFIAAYNTLGVIHRRHGEAALAERSFDMALALSPDSPEVLSNLISLLKAQGRRDEVSILEQRLGHLQPERPFAFLDAGNAALATGDVAAAMAFYRRELSRMPYNAEVNYAIAVANARLGREREADKYLALASQLSTNLHDRDIYAGKLEKLRALSHN